MIYFNESNADRVFKESGPFVHLYTTPLENDVFFQNEKEKMVAMNYIAIAISLCGCSLLAFSIMSNHFHFILAGTPEQVARFWTQLKALLDSYYRSHGRPGLMTMVEGTPKVISSLKQLRTEIAYVIRNSFVARQDVHVFADPWSSGCLYFNPLLPKEGIPASALKGRALRAFTHSHRIDALPGDFRVKDGMAQMWSFVDYQFVESLYDNARQFIHSVLKNIEAQVETAFEMGEQPFLSDDELIPLMYNLCRTEFKVETPKEMDIQGRKKLATRLKYKYFASNKQLARLVQLSLKEVDALFPLSSKPR